MLAIKSQYCNNSLERRPPRPFYLSFACETGRRTTDGTFSAVAVCNTRTDLILPRPIQVLSAFAANPAVFGSDKFVLFCPESKCEKAHEIKHTSKPPVWHRACKLVTIPGVPVPMNPDTAHTVQQLSTTSGVTPTCDTAEGIARWWLLGLLRPAFALGAVGIGPPGGAWACCGPIGRLMVACATVAPHRCGARCHNCKHWPAPRGMQARRPHATAEDAHDGQHHRPVRPHQRSGAGPLACLPVAPDRWRPQLQV